MMAEQVPQYGTVTVPPEVLRSLNLMIVKYNAPQADVDAYLRAKGLSYDDVFGLPEEEFAKAREESKPWRDPVSSGQAALVASGKALTDLGRGAQGLYYQATGNQEAADQLKARQAEEETLYAPLREAHPIASALGESAPYLAAGGLTGALTRGAGLIGGMAAQGAAGGAVGGTMYAPTMDQRLSRAGMDAAFMGAGEGVGRMVGRMIAPRVPRAGVSQTRISDSARRLGYKVLPSSRTDSKITRQVVEGGLESTPGGATAFDKVHQANQKLFNRHALSSIGQQGDELSDDVLEAAYTRIGGQIDEALESVENVPVSDDLIARVMQIDDDLISPQLMSGDPLRPVLDRTYKILDRGLTEGSIPAKELMAQQSQVGKFARAAMRGQQSNPEKGRALFELQEALLDAAKENMPRAMKQQLDNARLQYRNLSTLVHSNSINTATGDVSPAAVARYLSRYDRKGFSRGKNRSPMYEGARFLGRVQTKLPSSGTAERSYMRDLVKIGGAGAGFGAGAGMYSDDFSAGQGGLGAAAAATLGAVAAPAAMSRMYLSRPAQAWMTRVPSILEDEALRRGFQAGGYGLLGE